MMRYRFVDRVVAYDAQPPPTMTIAKTFPAGDDCFTGPLSETVPVSLLVETLAMAGGHLILRTLADGRLPLLLKVEEAAVVSPVHPGETVLAKVALLGTGESRNGAVVAQAEGEASVAGQPVLRCRLLFVCMRIPRVNVREAMAS